MFGRLPRKRLPVFGQVEIIGRRSALLKGLVSLQNQRLEVAAVPAPQPKLPPVGSPPAAGYPWRR